MLLNRFAEPLANGQIELTRVPSGTGIDFLVWPIMLGAFAYIVYVLVRKSPAENRNKEDKN